MLKFRGRRSNSSRDALALKAGLWYTVGNFINKGLVFIATPIFTRIMTTTEYGDYGNFINWQSLLVVLMTLELYTSVNKARLEFRQTIDEYLSSIIVCGSTFTMLCYIVVLIFHSQVEIAFNMPFRYVNVMFLYLFFAPALNIFQVMNRVNLRYRLAITITIGSSLLSITGALLMLNVFEDRVFGRIIGYDVPLIAVNATIWFYTLLKGRTVRKDYIRYALTYSGPLIIHHLSMNILGTSDRIMVRKLRSTEESAVYTVGYSCAMIVTVLSDSVNQAMSPWLYDNLETKSYEKIRRINRWYVACFSLVLAGIMLAAPEILRIMGGKKYAQTSYMLPPVFVGCGARFLYTNYVNVENYMKKSRLVSAGTMTAALVNIVLNFIFIPKFGFVAAAYTTWFSYVCLMFFHYFGCRRIGFGKLYDNRFLFSWLAGESAFMILCTLLYRNRPVRYGVCAAYLLLLGAAAYRMRGRLKRILKMVF